MPRSEQTISRSILGKTVVSKSGKTFGSVGDLVFESRTGEIIYIVLKGDTPFAKTFEFERNPSGAALIPFNAVMATGDFVVVAEEDIV
jgi:sporulation protein YlmC with PRC-barrel domain